MILCISSCKYSESFLVLLSTSLKIVRGQTDLSYESQVHGIDWITVNSGWQKHGYIDTQSEHFGLREWFQWQGLSKALASLWNVTDIIMQESIPVSRFKDFFLVVWVSVRFVWKMFSLSYTCSLQWMPKILCTMNFTESGECCAGRLPGLHIKVSVAVTDQPVTQHTPDMQLLVSSTL